jgi:hypothetical protein
LNNFLDGVLRIRNEIGLLERTTQSMQVGRIVSELLDLHSINIGIE